ncbi:FMN-dependent NADH-azoreductase [Legionella brunensis]|uniref:FMN dependent NADH:quinone oxidoreductase n=1 Tax=Legionella brunensis TaxID=29422 RepID=A0A0W0SNQ1_9GAMM|nr:NAD(P)H-dependent oxidoreductase [Legionella brunensis]KTC84992.1 ACP phosphodiesterase [Legionella brunensis]
MKLLAIDASILGEHSVSRQLMQHFLKHWQQKYPKSETVYRDLDAQPISHLSQEILNAKQKSTQELPLTLQQELTLSETLINELLAAEEIVIGAPMYNFSIPTSLKAWIDRVVAAGRTFRYTDQGVFGLATGKKLNIISTRGNHYTNSASMQAMDHQESYLKTIFNFIGITEIKIIRAEGLHLGESIRKKAIAAAEQKVRELLLKDSKKWETESHMQPSYS